MDNDLRLLPATLLLLLLMAVPAQGTAEDGGHARNWGLADLMQERSEIASGRARFEETRSVKMLKDPVQLKGTLVYRAPDYFRKTVTYPHQQELEVTGDRVSMSGQGGERQFGMDDHPALEGLIAAVRGTLAGDLNSLERHFEITFRGKQESWKLLLRPATRELSEVIERIAIQGQGVALSRIEIQEANGDSSIMHVH